MKKSIASSVMVMCMLIAITLFSAGALTDVKPMAWGGVGLLFLTLTLFVKWSELADMPWVIAAFMKLALAAGAAVCIGLIVGAYAPIIDTVSVVLILMASSRMKRFELTVI